MAALLVVLAVTDIAVQRLPDVLVLPALLIGVLGTVAAAMTGEINWNQAMIAGGCMAGLWILFYGNAFFTGGLGFGDVKLAGLIGVVLGTQGIVNAVAIRRSAASAPCCPGAFDLSPPGQVRPASFSGPSNS